MSGLWVAFLTIIGCAAWGIVLVEGYREIRALLDDEDVQ